MSNDFKDLFGDWKPEDEGRTPSEGVPEPENRMQRSINVREVKVVNVYEGVFSSDIAANMAQNANAQTYFVQMRDNLGREFRIFVLRNQAFAISMALDRDTPDRPFTHDLMKTMLERLGASVDRITIDDLWQDTFYAKITLSVNGQAVDIDARPSDALALALRFRAPIYVAEAVLEAAQQDSP